MGHRLALNYPLKWFRSSRDLRQIDVDWLLSRHPVGSGVQQAAFDLQSWLQVIKEQRALALTMGILDNEFLQAEEFIKCGFQFTHRIFNNGDFYPRNLIKFADRMVLIDWEYRPGYRNSYVDYLVNVAAFAFVHMWSNSPWQKEFVRRVREKFDIEPDDFRSAVLIKSFEQADFWRRCGAPQYVPDQVNQFKIALTGGIAG